MSTSSVPHASKARVNRWMRWCLFAYLIVLTYALLSPDPFAWFSSPSSKPPQPMPFYLAWLKYDKLHHFVAYGILTSLILASTRWSSFAVLGAAAFHGGGMEILQQWFPPRAMELEDWIADLCGAATVLLIQRFWPRRRSD